jgi:hypothetical protein
VRYSDLRPGDAIVPCGEGSDPWFAVRLDEEGLWYLTLDGGLDRRPRHLLNTQEFVGEVRVIRAGRDVNRR